MPSGQGSIVAIEVPIGPNGAEIYDGQQRYSHPALMQPVRPSVRELVDAAIEKRPYDWHRLPTAEHRCAAVARGRIL